MLLDDAHYLARYDNIYWNRRIYHRVWAVPASGTTSYGHLMRHVNHLYEMKATYNDLTLVAISHSSESFSNAIGGYYKAKIRRADELYLQRRPQKQHTWTFLNHIRETYVD